MSSVVVRPFAAYGNAVTVNLAVTAGSARVQVQSLNTSTNAQNGWVYRVTNTGSIPVWIELGDVTITAATTTGMILNSGATETVRATPGQTYIAAIATTTGATIYATPGDGV